MYNVQCTYIDMYVQAIVNNVLYIYIGYYTLYVCLYSCLYNLYSCVSEIKWKSLRSHRKCRVTKKCYFMIFQHRNHQLRYTFSGTPTTSGRPWWSCLRWGWLRPWTTFSWRSQRTWTHPRACSSSWVNKKNSQGSDLDCRGVGWLNSTTISFVARKSVTMRVVWMGALS